MIGGEGALVSDSAPTPEKIVRGRDREKLWSGKGGRGRIRDGFETTSRKVAPRCYDWDAAAAPPLNGGTLSGPVADIMIDSSIQREHVLQAIDRLERTGWSSRRHSTKFDLLWKGRRYPPKEVVREAADIAGV